MIKTHRFKIYRKNLKTYFYFNNNFKMSLRKYMHKRNKYKEEPNFKQLAILYPEFRKVAVTDIAGKIKINFKDEESLRILTKTLLKHDFNLEVDIPSKNLVPALPLRLNYILWIEDLLKHSGISDLSVIHGIDIGTGAICVYPLLFSKIFNNKMTCTDINPESISAAINNIERNNLQMLIKVILVKKESILNEIFEENITYSFLMCNPPFFKTDDGLGKKIKQGSPRNAPTGSETELAIEGGERKFILRLIEESIEYKDKVKIYTTMFGQRSSLAYLRSVLSDKGIVNATWTEFCQGFTKRWGIAWTFAAKHEIDLTTAPVIRTRTEVLKLKKDKSLEIVFPAKENFNNLIEAVATLKIWIDELKLKIKEIEIDNDKQSYWACQLTAYQDTWSHARRKRRMAIREAALKKQCLENSELNTKCDLSKTNEQICESNKQYNSESTNPIFICTLLIEEKDENDNSEDDNGDDDDDCEEDKSNKNMIRICMIFDSGTGGKLSLETFRQYLVNKLNIRKFFVKQHPSKPNKKKRQKNKLKQHNISNFLPSKA